LLLINFSLNVLVYLKTFFESHRFSTWRSWIKTAFVVSWSNNRDEITIYLRKNWNTNRRVVWWPVVSGIFVSTVIKIS